MTERTEDETPNEILAEVKAHAAVATRAIEDRTKRWPLSRLGFGAAIGSAAVAAAVLYGRSRGGRDED